MNLRIICFTILMGFLPRVEAQTITAAFTAPDTICVDQPFNMVNTSSGATNYYWSFCSANLNANPQITSLGQFPGTYNQPVFMDYVFTNNKYYAFVTNYRGGNLIRLDFGSSLLNTPVAYNLGNFGGILPAQVGTEGIQLVNNEGKWYAIIVGGYTPSGSTPRIVRIAFGANIENLSPVATDWGNMGNMHQPIDLHVFQENDNWYGITVNAENNTITRFNFSGSFENSPSGTNLGNIGNLSYPTGLYAINDNGRWRVFITNAGDNTRIGGGFSLTRLDFGNSLLNTPTGVNLGNIGNMIGHPRDLTIIRSCDQIMGFVANGHPNYNNLIRIDFNNDLTSIPSPTTLPNGNLDFPHSISRLFRVNEDVYGFMTDAGGNSVSSIRFSGCNNANIANSSAKDPPVISYNAPGTYNINLTIDIGLPTQASFCKKVVVVPCDVLTTSDTTICAGSSVNLFTIPALSHSWSPTLYLDDPTSATPVSTTPENITYYVDVVFPGNVIVRDSIHITVKQPYIKTNEDTTVCAGSPVPLKVTEASSILWSPSAGLSNTNIPDPIARPLTSSSYIVSGIDYQGCPAKDTVNINVIAPPTVMISNDTMICKGSSIQLQASGGVSYQWTPTAGLNNALIPNPVSTAATDMKYRVRVTASNSCSTEDSVTITHWPYPDFSASGYQAVCQGQRVMLSASGGDFYQWSPSTLITEPSYASTSSLPSANTNYQVYIRENVCSYDTTINVMVIVNPNPRLSVVKSNDINCNQPTAQLYATGATYYTWLPSAGLDNENIHNPLAALDTTTTYEIKGVNEFGCGASAFIKVNVDQSGIPRFVVPNAFSPNGDGKNDCFGIKRWGSSTIQQFSVYNRWGQVIYQSNNPAECWNGTYKGTPQPPGGYIYIIKAQTICGPVTRKGMLTLVR